MLRNSLNGNNKNILMAIGRIAFSTFLSVVVYVIVYFSGEWFSRRLLDVNQYDMHWGISLQYAIICFSIVMLIGNTIFILVRNKRIHYIVMISSCVLSFFTAFFIGSIMFRPYRTLLLCISGIVGVVISTIYLITCRKRMISTQPKR